MALRWFKALVRTETRRMTMHREYCKAASSRKHLRDNPFFDKYADKIAEVQKLSPEEFAKILVEKLNPPVKDYYVEKFPEKSSQSEIDIPRFHGQKNLDQIMKLETLEDKSASEIELIWKQYHQSKDGIYAVLPQGFYKDMFQKLKEFPTFLFPLPRAEGYEFIMQQFLEHSCYFTSLINYQAYKENAPVCLTITFFTELMEKKGIVLMRGDYDNKALNIQEAQCLAHQLQLYYGIHDEKKENLLWTFNKQPDTFRHMDLISNFEFCYGK